MPSQKSEKRPKEAREEGRQKKAEPKKAEAPSKSESRKTESHDAQATESEKSQQKSDKPPAKKTSPTKDVTPRADAEPNKDRSRTSRDTKPPERKPADAEPEKRTLRGAPARTAKNMDISLTVPTATSVRSVPVKLLWDNRTVINNHLARARGGKVSFTHIIGYALVKALKSMPEMNNGYDEIDGKPHLIQPAHINLGLAIDLPKDDGTRQLLVPSIKAAEDMDFAAFWTAYEEVVRKARGGKLTLVRTSRAPRSA